MKNNAAEQSIKYLPAHIKPSAAQRTTFPPVTLRPEQISPTRPFCTPPCGYRHSFKQCISARVSFLSDIFALQPKI
jgi:hypothetical protein